MQCLACSCFSKAVNGDELSGFAAAFKYSSSGHISAEEVQVCGLYITLTAQSPQRSLPADLAPTRPPNRANIIHQDCINPPPPPPSSSHTTQVVCSISGQGKREASVGQSAGKG
ncbi:hypothetical protein INR49_015969 [Caranx melampygus]|nr:hypothetical protein INR49_015969 [Caranx melampygus]